MTVSGGTPRRKRQGRRRGSILWRIKFCKRQNTISHYIATQSLLDLCEGSERALGARLGMRWWEQAVINLEGSREAVAGEAVAEEVGREE